MSGKLTFDRAIGTSRERQKPTLLAKLANSHFRCYSRSLCWANRALRSVGLQSVTAGSDHPTRHVPWVGEGARMKPKRRHYVNLAGALAMSFPAIAAAQQPSAQTPRIGLIAWWPCDIPGYVDGSGEFGTFLRGLRELGYTLTELSFECRSAGKHDNGLAAAATELVRLPVDLIVTIVAAGGTCCPRSDRSNSDRDYHKR